MTSTRFSVALAAASLAVAVAVSVSAEEVSELDRFQLWNECRPMRLVVEGLPDGATAIDLTKDAIKIAVRSRLRAARIYSEDYGEAAWAYLYINVNVVGHAFDIMTDYGKFVRDNATNLEFSASTWSTGTTGTHGGDSNYILSNVAQHADKFIDEYLRVNADACK